MVCGRSADPPSFTLTTDQHIRRTADEVTGPLPESAERDEAAAGEIEEEGSQEEHSS